MPDLEKELAEAKERIALLENSLQNAVAILGSEGYFYAKEIYKRFPEFKPRHIGLH